MPDRCAVCGHTDEDHQREVNHHGADMMAWTGCNVEDCDCDWFEDAQKTSSR